MIIKLISVTLGVYLTVALKNTKDLGAIKGSALATILFWPVTIFTPLSLPYFFGGSFIGMTEKKILHPYLLILCAGIFPYALELTQKSISSMGGALGFSAFVSVLIVFSAVKVFLQSRDQRT